MLLKLWGLFIFLSEAILYYFKNEDIENFSSDSLEQVSEISIRIWKLTAESYKNFILE